MVIFWKILRWSGFQLQKFWVIWHGMTLQQGTVTECRNGVSDGIHDSLPVSVSDCPLYLGSDSLSVTDSGSHSGALFEALFCTIKFRRNCLKKNISWSDSSQERQSIGFVLFQTWTQLILEIDLLPSHKITAKVIHKAVVTKKRPNAQNFGSIWLESPLQLGAIRLCVPHLLVNPAWGPYRVSW